MATHAFAVGAFGPASPSFRVRCVLPRPVLERYGVELRPLPLFTAEQNEAFAGGSVLQRTRITLNARRRIKHEIERVGAGASVAFVQRQADMSPSLGLERAAADGRRLVYDVDDAIWRDSRGAGGHTLAALKGTARKARWLAERADHVIAGNEILAEWLAAHNETVTVVPSLVDPERTPVRRHGEQPVVTLGWIGSATTSPYLHRLERVLRRLARERGPNGVRLLVVGGSMPPIEGVRVEGVPWSEETERDALSRIDIGLMPLPDTPWTRGKCAYKALQYMAAGIPAVADDVGISARVIGDGECGRIARSEDEWFEGLRDLAADGALRERLGSAGRARTKADFSLERWGPTLAEILRG